MKNKPTYDPRCYDLAETFLQDERLLQGEDNIDALARYIQQAIEEWIEIEKTSILALKSGSSG